MRNSGEGSAPTHRGCTAPMSRRTMETAVWFWERGVCVCMCVRERVRETERERETENVSEITCGGTVVVSRNRRALNDVSMKNCAKLVKVALQDHSGAESLGYRRRCCCCNCSKTSCKWNFAFKWKLVCLKRVATLVFKNGLKDSQADTNLMSSQENNVTAASWTKPGSDGSLGTELEA